MGDWELAEWVADRLLEQHDKPFFIACGTTHPHLPWFVPRSYFDLFPLVWHMGFDHRKLCPPPPPVFTSLLSIPLFSLVRESNPKTGMSAIHHAKSHAMIKELVSKGADIDQPVEYHYTVTVITPVDQSHASTPPAGLCFALAAPP